MKSFCTPKLLLAALLALPAFTCARQAPDARVTVKGQRGAAGDASEVITAKSKVLSRSLASSCAFMSGYSSNDDDVMLRYMSDFNHTGTLADPAEYFNDRSPDGDASKGPDGRPSADFAAPADAFGASSVACGQADMRFAAGRNRILRKDKTLTNAFAAMDRQDYATAMAEFKAAYDKIGYDAAALMLGKMYLYGMGTPRDARQAVYWLQQVVDTRYHPTFDRLKFDPANPDMINERVEAIMLLAKMNLLGIGVPKDAAEVRKWYAKAAEVGYAPAASMLGVAYLTGFGGRKDLAQARARLQEAGEEGYVPALFELGRLYYTGDDGLPQDYKMAGAYFSAAAKAGHVEATYAAARMYDLGQGVPVDQQRAIGLYKQAAVKGHPAAEGALGTYFYEGKLVPQDYPTARKLFNEAARQGQADAMFNLAVMTMEGQGGSKDMALAYVWFSLAKSSGYADADAALKAVAPQLTAQDKVRVDAVLKPAAKPAAAPAR
jgi:TPR repeat protein